MQVQIETEPKGYEPKTLKITFETEEEYEMFSDMMAYDVYANEPSKQTKLMKMMLKIQDTM